MPPGRVWDRPIFSIARCSPRRLNALASPRVTLQRAAFDSVLDDARAGDFVYFIPPVRARRAGPPTSAAIPGACFPMPTSRDCRKWVIELVRRGVNVVLSNSTAPSVTKLYERQRRGGGRRAPHLARAGPPRGQFQRGKTRRRRGDRGVERPAAAGDGVTACPERGVRRRTPSRRAPYATFDRLVRAREWRNWQTRRAEEPVAERP